jgi:hypothetical protein
VPPSKSSLIPLVANFDYCACGAAILSPKKCLLVLRAVEDTVSDVFSCCETSKPSSHKNAVHGVLKTNFNVSDIHTCRDIISGSIIPETEKESRSY